MIQIPSPPDRCELCHRPAKPLTRHHLIPKSLHRKKRFQKRFSKEELISRVCWVCRPCHNAIHRARTEQELGLYHNRLDTLRDIPELNDFVTWLSTKSPGFTPKQ